MSSSASSDEELLRMRLALVDRLATLDCYVPSELRRKVQTLRSTAQVALADLDRTLARRRSLAHRMGSLQMSLMVSDAPSSRRLKSMLRLPAPQHDLHPTATLSNVHLHLDSIPWPQHWDSAWVHRLKGLRPCDMAVLQRMQNQRMQQAMGDRTGPPEQRAQRVTELSYHFGVIACKMIELAPDAWAERECFELEQLQPLPAARRPDYKWFAAHLLAVLSDADAHVLAVTYCTYMERMAAAMKERIALTKRQNEIMARGVHSYCRYKNIMTPHLAPRASAAPDAAPPGGTDAGPAPEAVPQAAAGGHRGPPSLGGAQGVAGGGPQGQPAADSPSAAASEGQGQVPAAPSPGLGLDLEGAFFEDEEMAALQNMAQQQGQQQGQQGGEQQAGVGLQLQPLVARVFDCVSEEAADPVVHVSTGAALSPGPGLELGGSYFEDEEMAALQNMAQQQGQPQPPPAPLFERASEDGAGPVIQLPSVAAGAAAEAPDVARPAGSRSEASGPGGARVPGQRTMLHDLIATQDASLELEEVAALLQKNMELTQQLSRRMCHSVYEVMGHTGAAKVCGRVYPFILPNILKVAAEAGAMLMQRFGMTAEQADCAGCCETF